MATTTKTHPLTFDDATKARLLSWAKGKGRALFAALKSAEAYADAERKRVDAYLDPIFAKYEFFNDFREDGVKERITKKDNIYLSHDEELAAKFFAECNAAHREHGFTGTEGHCPALIAASTALQIETKFLNDFWACTGLGTTFDHYGNLRKRLMEIAVGLIVNAS